MEHDRRKLDAGRWERLEKRLDDMGRHLNIIDKRLATIEHDRREKLAIADAFAKARDDRRQFRGDVFKATSWLSLVLGLLGGLVAWLRGGLQ